jgi:hypothetical protein
MSNVKSQILSKVATPLDKFSDRLVKIAAETKQNTEAIAVLRADAFNNSLNFNGLVERVNKTIDHRDAKHSTREQINSTAVEQLKSAQQTLVDQIKEVEFENNKREEAQTLRDQNNVQSLVNLRESTQKAFSQVRDDVAQLMRQIQLLNERVGKAESANKILVDLVAHQGRQQQAASHHTNPTINFKLAGVYDVTAELDKRLQVLEAEQKLVEAWRAAQAAYIAGPVK